MPEMLSDVFGLVNETAADRPGIHLDESDEIGVLTSNEMRDVIEHASAAAQISRAR